MMLLLIKISSVAVDDVVVDRVLQKMKIKYEDLVLQKMILNTEDIEDVPVTIPVADAVEENFQ